MTTVAVDIKNKIIVTDSKVSGSGINRSTIKVFTLKDGSLVAFCGDAYPAMAFIEWMESGCIRVNTPIFKEDSYFQAVTVEDGGVFTWDNSCYKLPIVDDEYYTMGSGSQWAMSALIFGADLYDAVEFACEMDDSSGGLIRTYIYAKTPIKKAIRLKK